MDAPRTPCRMAGCFWPGVTASHLQALDERVARSAAQASRANDQVRYLGSILLREDEVVLCVFEGSAQAVNDVAVRAEIPFNRILDASWSRWPLARQTDKERGEVRPHSSAQSASWGGPEDGHPAAAEKSTERSPV